MSSNFYDGNLDQELSISSGKAPLILGLQICLLIIQFLLRSCDAGNVDGRSVSINEDESTSTNYKRESERFWPVIGIISGISSLAHNVLTIASG